MNLVVFESVREVWLAGCRVRILYFGLDGAGLAFKRSGGGR